MTAPKLPEGLEPVAWAKVRKDHMPRMRMLNESYLQGAWDVPLVRLSDAQAALQAQAAEIAALREDAARYRWLRATTNTFTNDAGERIDVVFHPEQWDAAIDSALLAAKEAKQ